MKKLVTHDGSFHADDIFAAAALSILLKNKSEDFEILRTRDEKEINSADYVFDVGGIYDETKNRFDHHQVGGAGTREGILYAAFGLVWKKFGKELCGSDEAAKIIEKKLVMPVDAWDNAIDLVVNKDPEISPFYLQHIFFDMEPTWREEDLNQNDMFLKSVEIAKLILSREIIQANDALLARSEVIKIYEKAADKRLIVLDKNYPFQYTLHDFSEPLFVVYPRKANNWWGVKTVRRDPKTFINRKNLPKLWAGLRDEELQNVSGVSDAIFCHRGLFMAVAKSREGAIKLAQIALESL